MFLYVFESVADVCFQQSDCKAKEVIFSIVDKKSSRAVGSSENSGELCGGNVVPPDRNKAELLQLS